MRRTWMVVMTLLLTGSGTLWATPSQITFQGSLKQKGVPVNGTRNMQFSFVDAAGSQIPGTSPISVANVKVTNGLFAVQLPIDPAIPWGQYSPFIQVSVEGQILSPNQPITASLYAVSAIPQGLIALFGGSCPVGWSRYTTLDGRFPRGADAGHNGGGTGGSATHNHSGLTGPAPRNNSDDGGGSPTSLSEHVHTIASDTHLPPYANVVFCQKQ